MRLSLKIALTIAVAIAVVGTAATGVRLSEEERAHREQFARAHLESMQLLALAVAPAVAGLRHDEVQGVLDNVSNFPESFPDARTLEIIGEDGRVLASLDPTRFNEAAAEAAPALAALRPTSRFSQDRLDVVVPIEVTARLGVARATFDVGRLERTIARQQRSAAVLVIGTMLVLGGVLDLLHRRMVGRRLRELSRAAKELGRGRMSARATVAGKDELAGLATSFNAMAGELESYTQDLEEAVSLRTEELNLANERLLELATTDALTGLDNRRSFDEHARRALEVSRRNERPLSVVLVDTDRFKSVNDRFGHAAGDAILKDVAALLERAARKSDLVARIGGEEFAVLMPETPEDAACEAAERMRAMLARADHESVPELSGKVTASFGVASRTPATRRIEDLLAAADRALYRSKSDGRNRVTLESSSKEAAP